MEWRSWVEVLSPSSPPHQILDLFLKRLSLSSGSENDVLGGLQSDGDLGG